MTPLKVGVLGEGGRFLLRRSLQVIQYPHIAHQLILWDVLDRSTTILEFILLSKKFLSRKTLALVPNFEWFWATFKIWDFDHHFQGVWWWWNIGNIHFFWINSLLLLNTFCIPKIIKRVLKRKRRLGTLGKMWIFTQKITNFPWGCTKRDFNKLLSLLSNFYSKRRIPFKVEH